MTAVQKFGLQETREWKGKTLSAQRRRVTDKFCLICLLSLLLIWMGLCVHAIRTMRNSDSTYRCMDNRHATNTSCEYSAQINSSSDALHNVTSLINSTIHLINNNQAFSGFYIWNAIQLLKCSAFIYFIIELHSSSIKISSKCVHLAASFHFTIISTGKLITTLIFTIAFFLNYYYLYNQTYKKIFILCIPEVYTCGISLSLTILDINILKYKKGNTFKNALRYYINRRNLILFQLLIFTIMVLIIALNIILLKNFNGDLINLLINLGSIFTIFFLNNYGKIVTMASVAHHDWDDEKKAVSLKEIVYAMFIINKYHLGTIFLSTLNVPMMYPNQDESELLQRSVISKNFIINEDIISHIVEHSAIVTAIHGQDFEESNTTMIRFLKEEEMYDSMSISSIVWKDISYNILAISIMFATSTIENVESLYSRIVMIGVFFLAQGTYNYIVGIMDTIEYTIEFCKVENERNHQANKQK